MVADTTKKRLTRKRGALKKQLLENEKNLLQKRNQLDNSAGTSEVQLDEAKTSKDGVKTKTFRLRPRESAKTIQTKSKFAINNQTKAKKGARMLTTRRNFKIKETVTKQNRLALRSKGKQTVCFIQ